MSKTKNFFGFFCCIFQILFKFWTFSKKSMNLVPDVFPKLRTPKSMATSMSKKSSLKGSYGTQRGKRAQTLLKFAWQNLYHTFWSLWMQLTCKRSLLVTCKISTLFPKTLSEDSKYSLLNRDNLTQPIQIQLCRKQKTFSDFFAAFLKSSLNFQDFPKKKKKMTLIAEVFPNLQTPKNMVTSMCKKSHFKGSFGKQYSKRAQAFLKFACQYLYHI